MLNMKKLITQIIKGNFVIEEGTENGWCYRKWSNGRLEQTLSISATLTTDSYIVMAQAQSFVTTDVKVRVVSSGSVSSNTFRIMLFATGTWK